MDECLSETLDATLKYNNYIFNNLPIHREDVSNFFIHRIPKFYASEEYSSEWYNHYLMSDEVKNLQPVS